VLSTLLTTSFSPSSSSPLPPLLPLRPATTLRRADINVPTIRDGYKGTYFYRITVAANLPLALRGRTYTINVTIDPAYFDVYPGKVGWW